MKKSQSITEYAIFFAAVIIAVIVMKGYMAKGYLGYQKKYSDSLGAGQFSYKYSNYNQVRETGATEDSMVGVIGLIRTNVTKGSSNSDKRYAVKSVTENDQITRTINADVAVDKNLESDSFKGAKSFDGLSDFSSVSDFVSNPDNLPTGYSVSKTGHVIDDFSNKNLTDDNKTFEED